MNLHGHYDVEVERDKLRATPAHIEPLADACRLLRVFYRDFEPQGVFDYEQSVRRSGVAARSDEQSE